MALLFLFNGFFDALTILFSALIHEIGHIFALKMLSGKIKSVNFDYGGVTVKKIGILNSYKKDILISFCGPLFNAVFACVSLIIMNHKATKGLAFFFMANLIYVFFNLLPIKYLDGGEMLYAALNLIFPLETAEKISNAVSFLILIPLIFFGAYIFIMTKCNFSLLLIAIALFTENIQK